MSRLLTAGLAFFAIGLFFTVGSIEDYIKGKASADWPTTEGTIVKAIVVRTHHRNTTNYTPSIVYDYDVNGKTYRSTKIRWANDPTSRKKSQALVDKYPVDTTVTVSYEPESPEVAVLEPGVQPGIHYPLGVGIVMILVGGVLTWRGLC